MTAPTPLADAADRFLADPGTTFTVPGHKRAPHLVDGLLAHDLPLYAGADDLRLTGDVLGRAERLAARLWGADRCRFSVGGSTHGNQSLALAVGAPGERVVVARTLHKSLFAGLVLADLEPVWVRPDVDEATGLALGVRPAAVAAALARAPDARAVLLVEPSYVGLLSDRAAIADLAHARGLPLLVDQAWGAHLGFHPELQPHALAVGADAMVTSAHKALTAFTQAAMVMANGERVDLERLEDAFEALHTTSPSGAILASIDRARGLLESRGPELLGQAMRLASDLRDRLRAVPGIAVLAPGAPSAPSGDALKVVVALAATGADGVAVGTALEDEGIRLEMYDRDTLVPIITMADTAAGVERLGEALVRLVERHRATPRAAGASTAWSVEPEPAMRPRAAFFARRERVPVARAIGRVAAETAAPYPPGIPALAPGEVVTRDLVEALRAEVAAGTRVAYASDPTLETLLVVAPGAGT